MADVTMVIPRWGGMIRADTCVRHDGSEMAIARQTRAEILRPHLAKQWKIGTIARQLGLHHNTVDRTRQKPSGRRSGSFAGCRCASTRPNPCHTLDRRR